MRLISWNILCGGGNRVKGIANTINGLQPDLCVISEYRCNIGGESIAQDMLESGLTHQAFSATTGPKHNGVGMFSRYAMTVEVSIQIPAELAPYVVIRRIGTLIVAGAYCATSVVGTALVEFLSRLGTAHPDISVLAAGDFFFGERGSSSKYYNSLLPLSRSGWTDVWRNLRGNEVTWSYESGVGKSRPDHIFIVGPSRPFPTAVYYVKSEALPRLSDHLPMVIEFELRDCQNCERRQKSA